MEDKTAELKGCLDWTLKLMRIAGYWIPKSTNPLQTAMYIAYAALAVGSTLIIQMCTEIAYFAINFGEIDGMIECMYLLLTHGMQLLKVHTFLTKRHRIYKLMDSIEEDDLFKPRNHRQFESAMKIVRYTNQIAKTFMVLVVATCLFCCLYAVMDEPSLKQLPARTWYPFDYKKSPVYEMAVAYQSFTISLLGCADCAMDMAAAAFISLICVQLEILNDSLEHIKEFAELNTATSSTLSKTTGQDAISPELQKEMKDFLVECIKHHLKIKKFAREVQIVFTLPMLFQFITAVATICLTLFELSMVPFSSLYFWHLFFYQGCMMVQIALYCWYGNEVTLKSKKLYMSLYNSEWVDCSEDYKNVMLLAMVNMQKELTIRVIGILTFSLETFVTVLRTSWSYYLVLDQVRET